jgi:hypothetical protein
VSIPHACYLLPCPPFETANRRATAIIESWLSGLAPQLLVGAEDAICGWDGVALREGIVAALLESEGWDVDALDDSIHYPWDHAHTRDAMAEWVRRGPTMLEEVKP